MIKPVVISTVTLMCGCSMKPFVANYVSWYCDKPIEERMTYKIATNFQLEDGECIEMRCPGDLGPSYCYEQPRVVD